MSRESHINFLSLPADVQFLILDYAEFQLELAKLQYIGTPETDSLLEKYYANTLKKYKKPIGDCALQIPLSMWTDTPSKQGDYFQDITGLPKGLVALACLIHNSNYREIDSLPWKLILTDMWTLMYALDGGVNINQALIEAVSRVPNPDLHPFNYYAPVKTILKRGPEINYLHKGETALIYAAGSGQIKSVEALLIHGAIPPKAIKSYFNICTSCMGNKVLFVTVMRMLRMMFMAGGELKDAEGNIFTYFLQKQESLSYREATEEDIKLLHQNFENKNLNKVSNAIVNDIIKDGIGKFIENEYTIDFLDNREFLQVALHYNVNMHLLFNYACKDTLNCMAFDYLLDHGVDVNQVDQDNKSPLFNLVNNKRSHLFMNSEKALYLSKKEEKIAKLLEKKANVNYQNNGITALELAFHDEEYSLNIIKMLLKNGADISSLITLALTNDSDRLRLITICECLMSECSFLINVLECLSTPPVIHKEIGEKTPKTNLYLIKINKLEKSFIKISEGYCASQYDLESNTEEMLYDHFYELMKHSDNVNKFSLDSIRRELKIAGNSVNRSVVEIPLKSLQNKVDQHKKEIKTGIEKLNEKLVENEKTKFKNKNKKYYDEALLQLEKQIQNFKNSAVVMNDDDDDWGGDVAGDWENSPKEEKINKLEDSDDDDEGDAMESEENNIRKDKLLIRKDILLQIGKFYNFTTSERSPGSSTLSNMPHLYQNPSSGSSSSSSAISVVQSRSGPT